MSVANSVFNANRSLIRTAVAASSAQQSAKFAPHLAAVERQPGIRPADLKDAAPGPYKFDDQTWLRLLQTYGSQEGLGETAARIKTVDNGARTVPDPERLTRVLALRDDPEIARTMATYLAAEQIPVLGKALGRMPTDGELYLSHILGPDRAARLIATNAANPAASATELFPEAARRMPGLFGSKAAPKTVEQVMAAVDTSGQVKVAPARTPRFTDYVGQALTISGTAGPVLRTGS